METIWPVQRVQPPMGPMPDPVLSASPTYMVSILDASFQLPGPEALELRDKFFFFPSASSSDTSWPQAGGPCIFLRAVRTKVVCGSFAWAACGVGLRPAKTLARTHGGKAGRVGGPSAAAAPRRQLPASFLSSARSLGQLPNHVRCVSHRGPLWRTRRQEQ